MKNSLELVLKSHQKGFHNLTPFELNKENIIEFDFSEKNKELVSIDFKDEASFCNYVNNELNTNGSIAGIGGYGEHRIIYSRSEVFDGEEARSVHLGLDIWTKAGTPIFAPLEGEVHSFQINKASGDYGPTIILEHRLDNSTFFTLYGHLSTASLEGLQECQSIQKGQQIATLGEYHENVHWPPHLHFQIIKDLEGRMGDYPGVAAPSEAAKYLANCPNPFLVMSLESS